MSFNHMPNKCGVAIPGKKPNNFLRDKDVAISNIAGYDA
jgi:hypothetical protein